MSDEPPAKGEGQDDDKATLAERFARKLSERRAAAPSALFAQPQPAAPAAPAPAVTRAPASAGPPPPPPPPPEPQKIIEIQFDQLRAKGYITPQSENNQTVEEFRLIKRQIMRLAFAEDGSSMRDNGNVIMVTSSLPSTGKSFTALNLAISFSLELDFYVLLIDADNRNHTISKLLSVDENETGMVDLLIDDKLEMRDIIRRTTIPNLSIITAGRPHLHGTELMASKQMAGCLQDLTKRYPDRIIFIDAPPLLSSTEGLVLAPHVGQALVVVEKDRTTKKALNQALERLQGCPEVSCVLYDDPNGRRRPLGKIAL